MASPFDQICVTLLTPTYSTLPRLNTTVLLLFVLLSPTKSWATKGALAALMARVATIAIHAIVMLATKSTKQPLDLDLIGAWFILSETAVSVPIMLCWSPALDKSKARILVRIWGTLVFIGAICGFTTVQWVGRNVGSQSCTDSEDANGHGAQLSISRNELFPQLESGSLLGKFDIAAVAAAAFGLWSCIRPDSWSQYESKKHAKRLVGVMEIIGSVFSAVVLVASIALHERYMLGEPRLPMLLSITTYEQWNCWAATGFIVAATLVSWALGRGEQPSRRTVVQLGPSDPWAVEAKPTLEWSGVLGRPVPSYVS